MSNAEIKQTISDVFEELATALETGAMGPNIKIALTINGSEHGYDVMKEAAEKARAKELFEVVLIGEEQDWTADYEFYEATSEEEVEATLDRLLDEDVVQGGVTLHHAFPIGISTVGRIFAPATNRDVFIATTTGTTATVRNQALVLNTINGIIAAKAAGIEEPTVGVLNVDGANTTERALKALADNGYEITFGQSIRADGGSVLRGNDLLVGSTDVIVTDSLTGNILMKLFSAYNTGGRVEATGYGYGPGIGEGFDKNIHIVSRASGAAVIANAMEYASQVAKGGLVQVSQAEYKKAHKAKLGDILEGLTPKEKATTSDETVEMPEKEVVTESISGIDVLDLDLAVELLWKADIYAESGMGCAGPIVLVSEANVAKARDIMQAEGLV